MTKKLLFLDLNGVSQDSERMTQLRPGFQEVLLPLLFEKFHVCTWTSTERYKEKGGKRTPKGESRVKHAFGARRGKLGAELYQSACTHTNLNENCTTHKKPVMLKELSKVVQLPEIKAIGDFGPHNTILVDDTPSKTMANAGWACVWPQTFEKDAPIDCAWLVEVLTKLSDAPDHDAMHKIICDTEGGQSVEDDIVVKQYGGLSAFLKSLSDDGVQVELPRAAGC